jgi:hypothetical protein
MGIPFTIVGIVTVQRGTGKLGNHFSPMPEQDADLLQILIG